MQICLINPEEKHGKNITTAIAGLPCHQLSWTHLKGDVLTKKRRVRPFCRSWLLSGAHGWLMLLDAGWCWLMLLADGWSLLVVFNNNERWTIVSMVGWHAPQLVKLCNGETNGETNSENTSWIILDGAHGQNQLSCHQLDNPAVRTVAKHHLTGISWNLDPHMFGSWLT